MPDLAASSPTPATPATPAAPPTPSSTPWCSFCGKDASEVGTLVAGPGVFICDQCTALCSLLIEQRKEQRAANEQHGAAQQGTSAGTPPRIPMWEQTDDATLLDHLPRIARLSAQVNEDLRSWVDEARQRGLSWEKIGGALGTTRQSAWEKFS